MKDILSAFQSDVLKPLASLIIPGAIAISSWFALLLEREQAVRKAAIAYHNETIALLVIAIVFVGMLMENLGSWIESNILDAMQKRTNRRFIEEWWQYLLVVYKSDPVARSYLRSLLQRLKFELDSAAGLFVCASGSLLLDLPTLWRICLPALCIVLATFLILIEARTTHKLMGKVRHALLTGKRTVISDDPDALISRAAAGK